MLYTRKSFTCPASGKNTSQRKWDLAFLTKEEYKEKYNLTEEQYQSYMEGENDY